VKRQSGKLAPFAENMACTQIFPPAQQFATKGFSYDPFLAVSPPLWMNFDAGHFFGSTGIHPNTNYRENITTGFSVFILRQNRPEYRSCQYKPGMGQGEMPLADVLLLIKKNKWPIPCDIELEYEIKPWSNAVKEVKTCVQYARNILM
jgi:hypothetical protein